MDDISETLGWSDIYLLIAILFAYQRFESIRMNYNMADKLSPETISSEQAFPNTTPVLHNTSYLHYPLVSNLSVIKVGGSIAQNPEKLQILCEKIGELSKSHQIVVVPGGGEFADTVRQLDKRFLLSNRTAHCMAILAMDQYGLLLADLTANSVVVQGLKETQTALAQGKVPIFLPSQLVFAEDPLENSWDITSDSIALYLATKLEAQRLLLVTDVDGIYTQDPKRYPDAELINKITPYSLTELSMRTSVDLMLPKLLLEQSMDCFVINGLFPQRIKTVLDEQPTVYTLITKSF